MQIQYSHDIQPIVLPKVVEVRYNKVDKMLRMPKNRSAVNWFIL